MQHTWLLVTRHTHPDMQGQRTSAVRPSAGPLDLSVPVVEVARKIRQAYYADELHWYVSPTFVCIPHAHVLSFRSSCVTFFLDSCFSIHHQWHIFSTHTRSANTSRRNCIQLGLVPRTTSAMITSCVVQEWVHTR